LKVASLGLYRLLASKASTRQAYAQDLADFARFLGADSSQAAALQLLAGGPGLANQLVHDYLVQLRSRCATGSCSLQIAKVSGISGSATSLAHARECRE
jgi:hypothetical protein